jgi:primosomal protein N' (replication factor Y)
MISSDSPLFSRAGRVMSSSPFVDVAFNVPIDRVFTYRSLPDRELVIGTRVAAPFGARNLVGHVVAHRENPPEGVTEVRQVTRVTNADPLFDEEYLKLAYWIAGMYFSTLGEALSAMTPGGKRETAPSSFGADDTAPAPSDLQLTDEQSDAISTIFSREGLFYVYGITGSGKTEVFLQAAERTIAAGRSAIYLVPEISLTHQLLESVRHRFPEGLAVLHSRLTPSQRLSEWQRIRRGEARLVIGARSAVFAPVRDLGLVVLDEEDDGSYKSSSSPRYHARQVAMKRIADAGGRMVMGSATPSVEAWQLMAEGRITRINLTKRVSGGAIPTLRLIDLRKHPGPLSDQLLDTLRETHAAGRQSILFLNRRGFAHYFYCRSCSYEMKCARCSVGLTYHKHRERLVCHYCGYQTKPVSVCPECGSLDVGFAGFGTERIEEELHREFPEWRICRLDTDAVRRKGVLEAALAGFRNGQIDVLLGTQMVAKGLNFPGVKLVGIVMADSGLHLPDFRAAERTFALIVQVAGRAGRFHTDGEVIIQAYQPENPAIQAALRNDSDAFYGRELAVREQLAFPPNTRLIRLVIRGKSETGVRRYADVIAARVAREASAGEVLGPAECPLAMIAGNVRRHVIIRTRSFGNLHAQLTRILPAVRPPRGIFLEVDVDPVSLL